MATISRPGPYTFQLRRVGAVAEARFEVGIDRTINEWRLDGAFLDPLDFDPRLGTRVSCRLSLGEVPHEGGITRFLIVDRLVIGDKSRNDLPRFASQLPADANVTKAEMDFLGQVWVVVQSGRKSSLVLWNLRDQAFRVLVPWGERAIELGTTPASSHVLKQNVVIAGLPGQTKFTTTTVNRSPGSTSHELSHATVGPSMPTTRGATPPAGQN